MKNLELVSIKKKKFVSIAFLLFLAVSTTSTVLGAWSGYSNCTVAANRGGVWNPTRIIVADGKAAEVAWYSAQGKVDTSGYSFGIGTRIIKQVKISLRCKASMSFAQYKAYIYYDGDKIGTSETKMFPVGQGYQYIIAFADITDTYCNPDDFTIQIHVSKNLATAYMDHVRADVEY